MNRRLLLIAYSFPPVGGAGVQRVTKFSKYLPDCGWDLSVLTVQNPSVPVRDSCFARDVPESTHVIRARTWEPSYGAKQILQTPAPAAGGRSCRGLKRIVRRLAAAALQPDPQILWQLPAYRAACRVLNERHHDAVLVSGPPFSSFLTGARLRRRFPLPLVLDFRDEWSLSAMHLENQHAGTLSQRLQERMQDYVLRRANAVIATTEASRQKLDERCRQAGSSATATCIYNGFDPDDIPRRTAPGSAGTFRLVYTGTLWKLTDVEPLVRAVMRLCVDAPHLASRLQLVFAGRRTETQQAILAQLRSHPVKLELHDYLDHDASLELASGADHLCLLLSGVAGAQRVVPAKLFEYLALQRPILAIAPSGELRQLLQQAGTNSIFFPGDVAQIADYLQRQLHRRLSGDHRERPRLAVRSEQLYRFSRPYQARQLAEVLSRLTATAPGGEHGRPRKPNLIRSPRGSLPSRPIPTDTPLA